MDNTNINNTEPTYEIEIDFLGGDVETKRINEFMHAVDVFEHGKQFVYHDGFIITGNPDLSKLCEVIANAYEKCGGYAVFVGIRNINGKRAENPHAYFMKNVQSVSMNQGKNSGWALFKDILEQLGYVASIDEKMRVISVGM